jgi:hypothetical protein
MCLTSICCSRARRVCTPCSVTPAPLRQNAETNQYNLRRCIVNLIAGCACPAVFGPTGERSEYLTCTSAALPSAAQHRRPRTTHTPDVIPTTKVSAAATVIPYIQNMGTNQVHRKLRKVELYTTGRLIVYGCELSNRLSSWSSVQAEGYTVERSAA